MTPTPLQGPHTPLCTVLAWCLCISAHGSHYNFCTKLFLLLGLPLPQTPVPQRQALGWLLLSINCLNPAHIMTPTQHLAPQGRGHPSKHLADSTRPTALSQACQLLGALPACTRAWGPHSICLHSGHQPCPRHPHLPQQKQFWHGSPPLPPPR